MSLSGTAQERLEDIRKLEPTTNAELRDRWGMDSGKEVAAYLREELSEYTYRDDDSRIRTIDRPDEENAGDRSPESSASISESTEGVQHNTTANETADEGDSSSGNHEPLREPEQHNDRADWTNEEIDQAIKAAREAGYEDGYSAGQAAAFEEVDLDGVWRDGYREGYEEAKVELSNQTGTTDTDPTCLDCNGELYDFTDLASGQYHQVNGETVFVAGDYMCSQCAEWWEEEAPTA